LELDGRLGDIAAIKLYKTTKLNIKYETDSCMMTIVITDSINHKDNTFISDIFKVCQKIIRESFT